MITRQDSDQRCHRSPVGTIYNLLSFLHDTLYFQIYNISLGENEMVNSDEKDEELEASPPCDNDTLVSPENKRKEQRKTVKRIVLSMIVFSVVSQAVLTE